MDTDLVLSLCNMGWEEAALGELSRAPRSKLGALRRQLSWLTLEVGKLPPANPQGSCLRLEELKSLKPVLWGSGLPVAARHPNGSTSARQRGYFGNK